MPRQLREVVILLMIILIAWEPFFEWRRPPIILSCSGYLAARTEPVHRCRFPSVKISQDHFLDGNDPFHYFQLR